MSQISINHVNNFGKICRTCLMESSQMYSIFENSLYDTIMACVSVNIALNDGLPDNLCDNCYEKVEAFYKFKQLCFESNAKLLEIKQESLSTSNENLNLNTHENEYNFVNETEKTENKKLKQKTNFFKGYCYVNYQDNTYKCRTKTDGVSYICSICSDSLNSKQSLKNHIVTHLKTKLYFCDYCGRGYVEAQGLTKHMRHHTVKSKEKISSSEIRHKCVVCGQRFGGRFHFNMHMRTHIAKKPHIISPTKNQSENLGPPYNCTSCNKTFKSKTNLIQHIRRHNGEKPYVCALCGKAFVTSSELKGHDRKHKGIKSKHVCDICGKDFDSSTALQIHIRKHTGEKPFSCEECGRSYKEIGTLRKHTRIAHKKHGNKQFICEVCGRETISPSALVIHIRTHTGEKPFLCAECGREFISQGRLNKHKKSHKDSFL